MLNGIVDWQNFELFVKELYAANEDLIVEHDVTELGKSGTTRQIDVKVTQRSLLHDYVTIIECKYWNKPIERTIVDIVAASLEDLGAAKAAIFTTKGYQSGAEIYAKSKGIDIFVVREPLDAEWGAPGRYLEMYLNTVSGQSSTVKFPNAQAMLLVQNYPESTTLSMSLDKDNVGNPEYQLFSILDGNQGPNLTTVLQEIHKSVTEVVNRCFGYHDKYLDKLVTIMSDVSIDISEFQYRQLRKQFGAINFDKLAMNFVTQLHRSKLSVDRAGSLEYGLIVQNYITDKSHYVSKDKDGVISLSEYNEHESDDPNDKAFVNGSTVDLYTQPWTNIDIDKSNVVAETSELHFKIVQCENAIGFDVVFEAQS
ncbi:restriction endonuclease [Vibrio aestuarianus]|uniref:restriction endonuclease n=1 Tax=Vibrio TaxID=662 RepID=UPI00237CE3D8|nr:restriction endonuclease [Vibrio aestuarianus]MDE1211872.1 restriction endonuclease [Vibrio aestuarianus]MDE1254972.1 restriction endonuclease [Vibrio aestuarianus]